MMCGVLILSTLSIDLSSFLLVLNNQQPKNTFPFPPVYFIKEIDQSMNATIAFYLFINLQ